MGITGLFKELGPGQRVSLAKLSADHYTTHSRPLRLAIDISIWLFQIQSGKGGSNPALRTFYYRLLRLLTLNIHPLFVFDGQNKPEWKRGKKVGGPGVRVASVPEFLAKQLLKQFGFPWHVAPGEAEADCALLQREGVVDAVLSEDVDTLMFGSGMTFRNWSPEGSTKSPTHVNVYREEETTEKSGLDREGMVLVALMSGGDYIPTGIAGCGPKLACDAARAGFAKSLCRLKRRDAEGLKQWKEELLHEVRTNVSKHFSRKNSSFSIPEDFPNWEVLGYYTRPCVSTAEKIRQMKESVKWDQEIDFAALRSFTADAFDWRCIGGAKKFIKNLAPAMLVRELRLQALKPDSATQAGQEERELELVHALHGKRNHFSADGDLEYRISFTPANFVPIDLNLEEEDDQFNPVGGNGMDSDAESEYMMIPSSTSGPDGTASQPGSPAKKRTFKPYQPDQPEKLWLLRPFLQLGCPLLVETYETPAQDAREFLKARRKARAAEKRSGNNNAPSKTTKGKKNRSAGVQDNVLMQYARVTKAKDGDKGPLQQLCQGSIANPSTQQPAKPVDEEDLGEVISAFKMPSTQFEAVPMRSLDSGLAPTQPVPRRSPTRSDSARPFAPFSMPSTQPAPMTNAVAQQRTPRKSKKRRSPDLSSPAMSQRTITCYYSPSPRKARDGNWVAETIDLVSSSPAHMSAERPQTRSPEATRFQFSRTSLVHTGAESDGEIELPSTVTKRRRKGPLRRALTAPATTTVEDDGVDDAALPTPASEPEGAGPFGQEGIVEITSSSPMRDFHADLPEDDPEEELPSPSFLFGTQRPPPGGGFLLDNELTPEATRRDQIARMTSPSASPSQLAPGIEARPIVDKVDDWLDDHDLQDPRLPASQSSLPSPPADELAPPPVRPKAAARSRKAQPTAPQRDSVRRSPRHSQTQPQTRPKPVAQARPQARPKKKVILSRTSLAGAWKEVAVDSTDVEALDLTGDGSRWKASGGRAKLVGEIKTRAYRKSRVEVLDLTGA